MSNKLNIGIDGFSRSNERDLEISLNVAEVFGTPVGQSVLKYLRSVTIEMVHGPNVSDQEIRHLEGQRYLVAMLENRIDHAHRSKQ